MRIFLTGGSGYLGSAVLDALVRAGHDVVALVRTKEKAARVTARGGHPVIGNLADPSSYRSSAEAQDGYIHAAFDSTSGRGPSIDRLALETMLQLAARPRTARSAAAMPRFLIYTSGVWVLGNTADPVDEDAPVNPIELVSWRPEHEQAVLQATNARTRTAVIRPGVVYGGSRGIVADMFKAATNGLVRVIGDGSNHWPLVYDRDLAELYARVVANQAAAGIYHANDEGDERVNDLVSAIVPHLSMRPDVRHVPIGEARAKMGPYAEALALDQRVRSRRSRELGWSTTLHSVSGNAARLLDEWRAAQA
jgi:nucleoside-diphosphate-sugar epimerase